MNIDSNKQKLVDYLNKTDSKQLLENMGIYSEYEQITNLRCFENIELGVRNATLYIMHHNEDNLKDRYPNISTSFEHIASYLVHKRAKSALDAFDLLNII